MEQQQERSTLQGWRGRQQQQQQRLYQSHVVAAAAAAWQAAQGARWAKAQLLRAQPTRQQPRLRPAVSTSKHRSRCRGSSPEAGPSVVRTEHLVAAVLTVCQQVTSADSLLARLPVVHSKSQAAPQQTAHGVNAGTAVCWMHPASICCLHVLCPLQHCCRLVTRGLLRQQS